MAGHPNLLGGGASAGLAAQAVPMVSPSLPDRHLMGPAGMAAMLPPPRTLVVKTVVVASLAVGVCATASFAAVAFTAGAVAMGAGGGSALASGASTMALIATYGAMFPAVAIEYYTSQRAAPQDDGISMTAGGLPSISGMHHHVEDHHAYEPKEVMAEREFEPHEYREVAPAYREVH